MKKKTFTNARNIAVLLSVPHLLGGFWFSDSFFDFIFFRIWVGLALLITPLVSNSLLNLIAIRTMVIILIIIGILNSVYMMFGDLTLINGPDFVALILRMVVLYLLIIMLRRTINPILEE